MAAPTRQLTVQQAEITTASIEIKALTLNRKQVTLSAFRQLIEESLVLRDGTLAGVPWGFVNYHPDKCADNSRSHWHVVWQNGKELRRSRVYKKCNLDAFVRNDGSTIYMFTDLNDIKDSEIRERHWNVREAIAELPQLFIAV